MIRIEVYLVPHGDETQKKIIGGAKIINDGTYNRNQSRGNYKYIIATERKEWTGRVIGFQRKRDNVWKLLRVVLNNLYGGEQP